MQTRHLSGSGRRSGLALAALLAAVLASAPPHSMAQSRSRSSQGEAPWQGEELPLPLAVRTPDDLAVKGAAERAYLIFNLLAGGKAAWDAGRFADAAARWERLLALPGLDPEIDKVIRPLAVEARRKAGGEPLATPAAPAPALSPTTASGPAPSLASPSGPASPGTADAASAPAMVGGKVSVSGTVVTAGGGGPGGAVVWLKRADGATPRPSPSRSKVINQRDKKFVPRILAVPLGSKVTFKNDDAIFHNVFSLSRPNNFDGGLFKAPESFDQPFKTAGPVQLLCNIHASMQGFIYVVDSPWYAQADASGAFTIKGVPPGTYDIEAWTEGQSKPSRQRLVVGRDGVRALEVRANGERNPQTFVPDKYGRPRQPQLGY